MKTFTTPSLALLLSLALPLAQAQEQAQAQAQTQTQRPASAQPAPAAPGGCATVEIHNVRPQQGHLMMAAYASAASFGKQPLAQLRVPAGEPTMRVQLCGLSGSEVALMLFQDLDSDGKMGRNAMGMPFEPWGSSGNPSMFGPQWDTGKVALDGSAITVRMSL